MFTHFNASHPILPVLFTYSSSAASLVGVEKQYWWRWGATKPLWITVLYIYSPSHSLDQRLILHGCFVEQCLVLDVTGRFILLCPIHIHNFIINQSCSSSSPKRSPWLCTLKKILRHWAVESWPVIDFQFLCDCSASSCVSPQPTFSVDQHPDERSDKCKSISCVNTVGIIGWKWSQLAKGPAVSPTAFFHPPDTKGSMFLHECFFFIIWHDCLKFLGL